MRMMWQMWEAGQASLADELNELCEQYPVQKAMIGAQDANDEVRRSQIRWIEDQTIRNQMYQYGQLANREAFGFDISYIPQVQHTIYQAEDFGHYDWHIDTFWDSPRCFDRKISVIIQLSDGDEYEGGDFELDPQYQQPNRDALRKKGTVFVFPSFVRHRVTPVTKGVRKSLVGWIEGPCFK